MLTVKELVIGTKRFLSGTVTPPMSIDLEVSTGALHHDGNMTIVLLGKKRPHQERGKGGPILRLRASV